MSQNSLPAAEELIKEMIFTTSRSSGPGGQNVNKVNTKVTLKFDINDSRILTDEQKLMLLNKLAAALTKEGVIILTAQNKRSQLANKEEVQNKFKQLLLKAFTPKKIRKKIKPGKAAKQKRIDNKKHLSEKKQHRQKPF